MQCFCSRQHWPTLVMVVYVMPTKSTWRLLFCPVSSVRTVALWWPSPIWSSLVLLFCRWAMCPRKHELSHGWDERSWTKISCTTSLVTLSIQWKRRIHGSDMWCYASGRPVESRDGPGSLSNRYVTTESNRCILISRWCCKFSLSLNVWKRSCQLLLHGST